MTPRGRKLRSGPLFFGAIGWLFADLLLALAMLFLVANSVGQVKVVPTPTPLPTPTATPIPTPTPKVLALTPQPVTISLDVGNLWPGLANGDSSAIDQLAARIRAQAGGSLDGKRAGLVLTFGGALGVGNGTALAVARSTDEAMRRLGRQSPPYVFQDSVYRDFFDTTNPPNQVYFDVYYFA